MIAEEVDVRRVFLQFNLRAPSVANTRHLFPLIGRELFEEVSLAAIGSAIVHPPNAATVITRVRLEFDSHGQLVAIQFVTDCWRLEQRAHAFKKML